MRHFSLLAAAAAIVFSSASFAQAAPGTPSQASQVEMGIQLARNLGSAMSAMPEMQQACGHTVDQKRRVKRVMAYLEEQVTKGSAAAGAAYRDAVKDGAAQTRALLAGKTPEDIARACAVVNQSFETELKNAEHDIPAFWVPSSGVAPAAPAASKPAAKAVSKPVSKHN